MELLQAGRPRLSWIPTLSPVLHSSFQVLNKRCFSPWTLSSSLLHAMSSLHRQRGRARGQNYAQLQPFWTWREQPLSASTSRLTLNLLSQLTLEPPAQPWLFKCFQSLWWWSQTSQTAGATSAFPPPAHTGGFSITQATTELQSWRLWAWGWFWKVHEGTNGPAGKTQCYLEQTSFQGKCEAGKGAVKCLAPGYGFCWLKL